MHLRPEVRDVSRVRVGPGDYGVDEALFNYEKAGAIPDMTNSLTGRPSGHCHCNLAGRSDGLRGCPPFYPVRGRAMSLWNPFMVTDVLGRKTGVKYIRAVWDNVSGYPAAMVGQRQ